MKPKLRLSRIPHPRWPRRGASVLQQTDVTDAATDAALPAPGGVLRVFRGAALAAIAAVITAASAASFAESYREIGPRPEGKHKSGRALYSLDRVNNDGNYEPGNVRWATSAEQSQNQRKRRKAA